MVHLAPPPPGITGFTSHVHRPTTCASPPKEIAVEDLVTHYGNDESSLSIPRPLVTNCDIHLHSTTFTVTYSQLGTYVTTHVCHGKQDDFIYQYKCA